MSLLVDEFLGLLSAGESVVSSSGDAMSVHEGFGPRFISFYSCCLFGGAKHLQDGGQVRLVICL